MSEWISWLTIAGLAPWGVALRGNWRWALRSALVWAGISIAVWSAAAALASSMAAYVALVVTACAGVAVLGARRPGVNAWNLVVAGLLAVLLVPLAEGLALGTTVELGTVRTIFLTVLLGTAVMNYLPTRFGPSAGVVGFGAAGVLFRGRIDGATWPLACIAVAPWIAWLCSCLPQSANEFDRTWLGFRDRFGAIWGLRLREQFNRAAANTGWNIYLGWSGLRGEPTPGALGVLRALTQRFGPADDQKPPAPGDNPPRPPPDGPIG